MLHVLRPGCDDTAGFTACEGGLLSEPKQPVKIELMDLGSMLERSHPQASR